jgi:hypothetical protein
MANNPMANNPVAKSGTTITSKPPELESGELARLQQAVRRVQQEELMRLVRWAYGALAVMAGVMGVLAIVAFMGWLTVGVAVSVALLLFLILSAGTVFWFLQARQVQAPKSVVQGTLVGNDEAAGHEAGKKPRATAAAQVDIAVARGWRLTQFGEAGPAPMEVHSPLRLQVHPQLYPALLADNRGVLTVISDGKTLLAYVAGNELVYPQRRVVLN